MNGKRFTRRILITVAVVAVLLLAMSVLVRLALALPPVQRYATHRIEVLLDSLLVGDVSIRGIRTDLYTHVTVQTLTARALRNSPDSVVIHDLRVNYFLPALITGTVRLSSIRADRATLFLTRNEQGRLVFPLLPRPAPPGAEPEEPGPWQIRLGPTRIDDIEGIYRDRAARIEATLSDAAVEAHFPRIDSVVVDLTIPGGTFGSPVWSGDIESIRITGGVDSGGLMLENLLVAVPGARVEGMGTIPFAADRRWDVSIEALLAVGEVVFLHEMVPTLARSGRVTASVVMSGTLVEPRVEAIVRASEVAYSTYRLDSLVLSAVYDTAETARIELIALSPLGTATLDGRVLVPDLLLSPRLQTYALQARIEGLRLERIEALGGLQEILRDPVAGIEARVSGTEVTMLPEKAVVEATVTAEELGEEPIEAAVVLDSTRWRLDAGWRRNTVAGEGRIRRDGALSGVVRARVLEPGVIARTFADQDAGGRLFARIDLGGRLGEPRVTARVSSPELRWRSVVADTLNAAVSWRDETLRILDAYAVVDGSLDSILLPLGIEDVAGDARLTVTSASGTLDTPRVETRIRGTGVRYGEYRIDRITGRILLAGRDTVVWRDLYVRRNETAIATRGTLTLGGVRRIETSISLLGLGAEEPRAAGDAFITGAIEADSIDVALRVNEYDLAVLDGWIPFDEELSGRLTARGTFSGTGRRLTGNMTFSVSRPGIRGIEVPGIDGRFAFVDSFARARARILLRGTGKTIDIRARVPFVSGDDWALDTSGNRPFYVSVEGDSIPLSGFTGIVGEQLVLEGGPLTLDARMGRIAAGWVLGGSVDIDNGRVVYNPLELAMSEVNLEAGLAGSLAMPRVDFGLTTGDVRLPSFRVNNSRWAGTLRGDTIALSTGFADVEPGGSIKVTGSVPISDVRKLFAGGDPELQFELTEVPITILEQFVPGLDVKSGRLEGAGEIILRGGRLTTTGALNLRNAVFDLAGIDTRIGPVNGTVDLAGDTLVIRDLDGRLGEGSIDAEGILTLGPAGRPVMNLRVRVDEASVSITDLATVRILSADLRIAPRPEGHLLAGTIELAETRIVRDIYLPALIELAGDGRGVARQPNEFLRRLQLKVAVDLRRNLYIDSNLGQARLGGTIALSGTAADPGITGQVVIVDGTVNYLDRGFDITSGRIRFPDPFELNPSLDITATTDVTAVSPSATGDIPETELYTITLVVTGTLERPEVILSSEPPLGQPDIVSVLTLGTTLGAVGGDLAARVQDLAANQLLGFGARRLERLLGLEDITITGGLFGAGPEADPRVTLTKRVTKRLTLTYGTALTAFEDQEVMAVYRLLRFLYLVGVRDQTGDAYAGLRARFSW